jgi:hypothetical protein
LACLVATLAAAAPAAPAPEFPRLRPGLWEMTSSSPQRGERPPMKSTLCIDESLQQEMLRMSSGMMQGMCSKYDLKVAANKVTGEAVCKLGEATMTSRSVMTMTGDTAYRTVAHASFDPPLMGRATSDTVIEGRHLGPCKPGQRPGDLVTPGGQSVNIRSMMGGGK